MTGSEPGRVPFHDPARAFAAQRTRLLEAMARVGDSGRYLEGPEVAALERELSLRLGRRQAVGVASGTDGLELALRALGVGRGDEVITVANAGCYVAVAAAQLGATPVFVDVDPHTLQLDPERVIDALSPACRAVVLTHLFGRVTRPEELIRKLRAGGVGTVEDCSQAHGARTPGGPAGSLADLAVLSFYPTKNLGALGDGGLVAGDDPQLLERVRRLASYGWGERFVCSLGGGRNSRLDELQAAVLRIRLEGLEEANLRRRQLVTRYLEAAGTGDLRFVSAPGPDDVVHLCVVRHPDRDSFRSDLQGAGIATAVHYPIAAHQQSALSSISRVPRRLEVTESVQEEILTLPCFPELSDAEADRICEALARGNHG